MHRWLFAFPMVCAFCSTASLAAGISISGPYALEAVLDPPSQSDSLFGYSVALDRNLAVVGQPGEPNPAAMIFSRDANHPWTLQATPTEPYGDIWNSGNYTACSGVATSNGIVLTGESLAPIWPSSNHGSVSEYDFATTWYLRDIIVDFDVSGSRYGCGLALDGDTMLVGAVSYSLSNSGGRAYVMVKAEGGWVRQAILTDNVTSTGMFSQTLALSGDVAVVGDPIAKASVGNSPGAAYVFRRQGVVWFSGSKLALPDGVNGAEFGGAVAVEGNTVVVGAPSNTMSSTPGAGSVYVYVDSRGVWVLQAELHSPASAMGGAFGSAVAIAGDTLVVGEMNADKAYVYRRVGGVGRSPRPFPARRRAISSAALSRFRNRRASSSWERRWQKPAVPIFSRPTEFSRTALSENQSAVAASSSSTPPSNASATNVP